MGRGIACLVLGLCVFSVSSEASLLAEIDYIWELRNSDTAHFYWNHSVISDYPPIFVVHRLTWPDLKPYHAGKAFKVDHNTQDFVFFANRLTNGIEDELTIMQFGSGYFRPESEWFSLYGTKYVNNSRPDLYGCEITHIDLFVNSVTVTPEPPMLPSTCTYDITFRIYGQPIPEPSTMLLLTVGGLFLKRKKAFR